MAFLFLVARKCSLKAYFGARMSIPNSLSEYERKSLEKRLADLDGLLDDLARTSYRPMYRDE